MRVYYAKIVVPDHFFREIFGKTNMTDIKTMNE